MLVQCKRPSCGPRFQFLPQALKQCGASGVAVVKPWGFSLCVIALFAFFFLVVRPVFGHKCEPSLKVPTTDKPQRRNSGTGRGVGNSRYSSCTNFEV